MTLNIIFFDFNDISNVTLLMYLQIIYYFPKTFLLIFFSLKITNVMNKNVKQLT